MKDFEGENDRLLLTLATDFDHGLVVLMDGPSLSWTHKIEASGMVGVFLSSYSFGA
jgi:hypothetical protein